MKYFFLMLILILTSCSTSENLNNVKILSQKNSLTSGEYVKINYSSETKYEKVFASLVDKNNNVIENYNEQEFNNEYVINRFLLSSQIQSFEDYKLRFTFVKEDIKDIVYYNINIEDSIIVDAVCSSADCISISGNIINGSKFLVRVNAFKIKPVKYVYEIITPYNSYVFENSYNSPVATDWIENISIDQVPDDVSFYIAAINIYGYDIDNNFAYTSLPIKVVRPVEVKHFGKHELAEVYEPVPVTGCIPGSVGNNVNYSESTSETRQNSVSITVNKSWSDSFSSNQTQTNSEGINVSETQGTVNSSSLSNSETQSESYTDSTSSGESNNISFNTSEGESWSWSLNNTETESEGQSSSNGTNTGVNASTTVGVSGEGSLPFLAKASGKVDVSAGVSRNWSNTDSTTSSESNSESRGYSTGGSSQNGRTYGSVQNDSRSHSLTGAYVLSNNSSSSTSESTSLSSGRVWNMSESINSGKVVTEGSGESIAQTVVSSNTSSTTFSYSGYIPRGRFGVFFRQTSRYIKLSEIITYDLNGFPSHAGFIMMNTWAWAPELSVGQSCQEAIVSSMPPAECLIPPCGE